jgi:hypothetical protein
VLVKEVSIPNDKFRRLFASRRRPSNPTVMMHLIYFLNDSYPGSNYRVVIEEDERHCE